MPDNKIEYKIGSSPDSAECPNCGYPHVTVKNVARRFSTGSGALAGALSGVAGGAVLLGGEAGAEVGAGAGTLIGGPVGTVVGAVLGGLGGAALGAISGHVAGCLLDKDVVGLYHCPKCKHKFLL